MNEKEVIEKGAGGLTCDIEKRKERIVHYSGG